MANRRMTKQEQILVTKYQNQIYQIVKNAGNYTYFNPITGDKEYFSGIINKFNFVADDIRRKRYATTEQMVFTGVNAWAIAQSNIYKTITSLNYTFFNKGFEADRYYQEVTITLNDLLGNTGKQYIRNNLSIMEQMIKDYLYNFRVGIKKWIETPYEILQENSGKTHKYDKYIEFWNENVEDAWGDDSPDDGSDYDY